MIKALLSLRRVTTSPEFVCKELANSPRLRIIFPHCLTSPNKPLANHNALNYRPDSQLPFYLPTPLSTIYLVTQYTYTVIQNFSKNYIKQVNILNIVVTLSYRLHISYMKGGL